MVFNASWADMCYYMYPMWVKFSNKYSTERVKVIEIDVNHLESVARYYKVDLSEYAG